MAALGEQALKGASKFVELVVEGRLTHQSMGPTNLVYQGHEGLGRPCRLPVCPANAVAGIRDRHDCHVTEPPAVRFGSGVLGRSGRPSRGSVLLVSPITLSGTGHPKPQRVHRILAIESECVTAPDASGTRATARSTPDVHASSSARRWTLDYPISRLTTSAMDMAPIAMVTPQPRLIRTRPLRRSPMSLRSPASSITKTRMIGSSRPSKTCDRNRTAMSGKPGMRMNSAAKPTKSDSRP